MSQHGTASQNQPGKRQDEPTLTGLERELLGYVERLTQACETSAAQCNALEQRSTAMIEIRQRALEDGVRLLIASQTSLVAALIDFVEASQDSATVRRHLSVSRQALMSAEQRLNGKPVE